MTRVRLVAVDLDGTLLKDDQSICACSHDALIRIANAGIKVVISTIRTFTRSKVLYDRLGFKDPLICCCGAEIYRSKDGGIDISFTIPISVAQKTSAFAEQNDIKLGISHPDLTFWKKDPVFKGPPPVGLANVNKYSETLYAEPIRILCPDKEKLPLFYDFCKQELAEDCNIELSNGVDGSIRSITIISKKASKGEALKYICNGESINLSDVMAIGDSIADKTMLDIVGYPVIMGNACQELKRYGYLETDSNEYCGVGKAIEKYIV